MFLAPKGHHTQPSMQDNHSTTTPSNRRKCIPTETKANMTLPSNHRKLSWNEATSRSKEILSRDYVKPNVSGRFPPHQETTPKAKLIPPFGIPTMSNRVLWNWAQIRTLEFLCSPHDDHAPESHTPTTELWTGHQNQLRGWNPSSRSGCCENQKRSRSSPARSPQQQLTDPPTRLARSGSATKRKGEARTTHLGSREELVRRRGGGGGGVAPATAVPVHPLLVALQREAPQLPQRRLHVLAPLALRPANPS